MYTSEKMFKVDDSVNKEIIFSQILTKLKPLFKNIEYADSTPPIYSLKCTGSVENSYEVNIKLLIDVNRIWSIWFLRLQ